MLLIACKHHNQYFLYSMYLCPCIRVALFISNLCDIMAVNIEGHGVVFFHFPHNKSYNLIKTDTLVCTFFTIYPIIFG